MLTRRGVMRAALVLGLAGCAKSGEPGKTDAPADPPAASIPGPGSAAEPATPPANLTPVPAPPPIRYDLPFAEATTTQLYEGATAPPPTTANGLHTAKLQADVRDLWPTIQFEAADGKPAPVVVVLDTDAGPVELTLFPDIAPSHVRNFLALAQLGYYNGLAVERVIRFDYPAEDKSTRKLEVLTAGCPAGDGESPHSHLGYFLKPERLSLEHEAGVIGFVRDDDATSACCRLYLTLTPAPMMDGHYTAFGKITAGLDTLKGFAARPVKNPATYPENEQFQQPVRIKSVTRK
ncbi:MAG: peptidylprolyl isomerase [Gemmataceae bacterium]|nr:peptidylprolyl isomerase [Gemmataceae bacterium]